MPSIQDDELLRRLFPVVQEPFSAELREMSLAYNRGALLNGQFSLSLPSMDIRSGVLHCVYGTNGCGKTTLLRTLAGILPPQKGTLTWAPNPNPRLGLDRLLVMQAGPMPHWTTMENIVLPMINQGISRSESNRRARDLIALFGLEDLGERYAHQLSAGQQQRTVIARAVSISPRCLLLDEILSAQSEHWAARIGDILQFYVGTGRMVVMVSHDPEWVIAYAGCVTNIVSNQADAVSTAQFFIGYNGDVKEWQSFRESRFRQIHE